ncbi:leucyl aminopeptidase [Granulicella tundricola]|uniref:Probable cytosol aminopeptidase n=1 Tax=Granulicella tundricola (strain ATCC BAA-1859 / DSM 23138 / MP5ACTX9) TaxID=1198114 RepID=E8WYQ5_GRATM|nr:leucyl aminopeptidase [Granulicella tundricola]ADW68741.1 Leucyl aminopeptidase [Granulicella tundricola MP5ACTX9]
MDTKLIFAEPAAHQTAMLVIFAVDIAVGKDAEPLPVLLTTSDPITNAAARAIASGEFKGNLGENLLLHAPAGLKAERLLIIGLGKAKTLSVNEIRKAAGAAVRAAKPRGIREISIAFPEDHALSDEHLEELPCTLTARVLVEGAEIAELDWDTYRSDRKDLSVYTLTVVVKAGERSTRQEIQSGFDEGLIVAAAQNFARHLVNEPGNVLTPTVLGARTKAMCDEVGLACEVYSTSKLEELKMGAFAAVAQGSAEPPALIVMTYTPAGPVEPDAPVIGLVGKGITFDTGGISIKPADNMEKMKYDMAGSAAMIGAMRAIAQLKPNLKVISVICSAENMPDGKAFKPGDVVTAMSGKTIEIINTDAEGRLVLADGLHYAKTLGCTHLIDAATLTGACVVALGYLNVGLFSNDDATWEQFMAGVPRSGEKFWRLPCTDDYRDQIKSQIGDIMNTGGRAAGAVTAAMFLKEFAGDTPWIHLDIAGCAWNEEQKPWLPKGPTGIAVRSIVEWVRSYSA